MAIIPDREREALRPYFHDVAASTPLSRQREAELATRIQQGDIQARNELVQANLRFVINVAREYQNHGLSLPDLISAGNEGLLKAAERFDGTRGIKFISYAVWWVRQSILQALAEQARTVRLPSNKLNLLKDIRRAGRHLGRDSEGEPDVEEIAAELEVPAKAVLDTLLQGRTIRYLDEALEEEDERTLENILTDNSQEAPDAGVLDKESREQIDAVLHTLEERERFIIRFYFGLYGEEPLTLERIGVLMNLTRERVRQLKERALNKLRAPERCKVLLALMDGKEV